VTFTASAVDIVDGSLAVTCTPASGSTFAFGATTVTCTAVDAHGNKGSRSFTVNVVDTTPPTITASANVTVNADPGQQARLNNLDSLLKLTPRWSEEYKRQASHYLRQLYHKVRKNKIKPTTNELLHTISEWLDEITAEETRMAHSIIRRVVLEQVNTEESPDFSAWLQRAEDVLA